MARRRPGDESSAPCSRAARAEAYGSPTLENPRAGESTHDSREFTIDAGDLELHTAGAYEHRRCRLRRLDLRRLKLRWLRLPWLQSRRGLAEREHRSSGNIRSSAGDQQ